jgi:hypothetical protein
MLLIVNMGRCGGDASKSSTKDGVTWVGVSGGCGLSGSDFGWSLESSGTLEWAWAARRLRRDPMLRRVPSNRLRREGLSLAGEQSPENGVLNSSQSFRLGSLLGLEWLLDFELHSVSLASLRMRPWKYTEKQPGHCWKNRVRRDSSWS